MSNKGEHRHEEELLRKDIEAAWARRSVAWAERRAIREEEERIRKDLGYTCDNPAYEYGKFSSYEIKEKVLALKTQKKLNKEVGWLLEALLYHLRKAENSADHADYEHRLHHKYESPYWTGR